jgi:ribonuclease Z
MMKMDPPTIYVPESAVEGCQQVLRAFQRLDRGAMPCELVGVQPGDELDLNRETVVQVVATRHTIPSVGYIVQQRRKKLKPEYRDLEGPQIRDLKIQGVEITEETRIPVIGYTGDTSPPGLDDNPAFYQARVLITEMTFLAPDHRKEKIHKHGHMHLDDFVARQERFQNELVIASHVSTRYNEKQARRYLKKSLPCMLGGRLMLWL